MPSLQMRVEKLEQRRIGPFQAVALALQSQELCLHASRPQFLHQPLGLLMGDVLVGDAVDAEYRRRVRRHPRERAGLDVQPAVCFQTAAEHLRQHVLAIHAGLPVADEIAGPADAHHAGDRV
ncbi:MAG: hypothetical protein WCQ91_05230 [Planctomycetota bacterium]